MLQLITWGTYLSGAGLLLVSYYMLAGATLYGKDIQEYIATRRKGASAIPGNNETTDGTADFEELEAIVHEIDSILEEAGTNATKEQLLGQLQRKLASYGGLRRPAFRAAVFNHIISNAENICGVRISAEELKGQA